MNRKNTLITGFVLLILILSSITIVVEGGVIEERNYIKGEISPKGYKIITPKQICCFPAGTKITMADKSNKNIENIEIGDKVLSYDVEEKRFVNTTVTNTIIKVREGVYKVNNGLLSLTDDHPLYAKKSDGRTVWAAINPYKSKICYKNRNPTQLEIGDKVFLVDETWVEIKSINYNQNVTFVYTFTVDSDTHDYFANKVLVTNQVRNICGEKRNIEPYPINQRMLVIYPTNPSPEDDATNVDLNPTLSVHVSNQYGLKMNVMFFNALTDEVIGIHKDVSNNAFTSVRWTGLNYDTEYKWYAIAYSYVYNRRIPIENVIDLKSFSKIPVKRIWSFTTKSNNFNPNNPPNTPNNPTPNNQETNIELKPTLKIDVSDPDGDNMKVTFYNAKDNSIIGTNNNVPNGTTTIKWTEADQYQTTYNWYVIAEDTQGKKTKGPADGNWSFTTKKQNQNKPPNAPNNPNPENNANNIELKPTLKIDVSDPDGDNMKVTFYNAKDNSIIGTNNNVPNASRASIVWADADQYQTTYNWYVIAEDTQGKTNTSETWNFTTKSNNFNPNNPPNTPNNPTPNNQETNIELKPTLKIDVSDPDGDNMKVTFYNAKDNSIIGTNNNVPNGTTTIKWTEADQYQTTYNWYVIAEDTQGKTNTSETWNFTTKSNNFNPNNPPNTPKDPEPEDNANNIGLNPILHVNVSDPDDDKINVTFYNAVNNEVIGIHANVCSGDIANFQWENLDYETEYRWYVVAEDTKGNKTRGPANGNWSFATKSKPDFSVKIKIFGIAKVRAEIENNAEKSISDIRWSIKVKGGLFDRVDVSREGIIEEIESSKSKIISTWDLWDLKSRIHGLGRIDVKVETKVDGNTYTEEAKGFVIGRIVLVFHRN